MTVSMRIATIVIGGLAGAAILLLTSAPGLGGAILGVSATAAAVTRIAAKYIESRDQYEAARGTLAGQRERMRIEFESRIAEHTARLNAAHQADIFQTQREWYEQGARDALAGRLGDYEEPVDGSRSVIQLSSHRKPHAATTNGMGCSRY